MCWQDGNAAIWHMLYETAGWQTEAGGSFFRQAQPTSEDRLTWAAVLIIELEAIPARKAPEGSMPPDQPEAAA